MNEQLIFVFRMHYQLIDLVSFELLLSDSEVVVSVYVTLAYVDVPHTDVTSRISHE